MSYSEREASNGLIVKIVTCDTPGCHADVRGGCYDEPFMFLSAIEDRGWTKWFGYAGLKKRRRVLRHSCPTHKF